MNNDLISREALKKKLQARHDNGEENFDKGYNIGIETAIDLIDNAPTVEPFERIGSICEENCGYRPKGEWIKEKNEWFKCSNCKKCNTAPYPFCSWCGADMREGGAE